MNIKGIFEVLALALALNPQAFADTTSTLNTEASRMNTLAASHGETNVTGKISGTFNSFLGSDSTAVVTGLRNGTPITLTTTTPAATPGAVAYRDDYGDHTADGQDGPWQRLYFTRFGETAIGSVGYQPADPSAVTGGFDWRNHYNRHRRDGDHNSAARCFDHAQPGHGLGSNRTKARN